MPAPAYYGREPDQPVKPSAVRHLSEFAVADTPGTSGPEYADGGDYLQARFAPTHSQQQQHPQPLPPSHGQFRGPQQPAEGGMPSALGRGGGRGEERGIEGGARRKNENVDAGEGQMEMCAEGRVADAVQRKTGTQAEAAVAAPSWQRARRESMSVGGSGAEGADRRGSLPGLHGRGMGEVTHEQQQAAARKQIMDSRKRGEDVDGRGTVGPVGQQPRAEID
ncbi:uncharacterized protein P884DRAFT_326656 [Thermothelomyces heterothallicus CBS 202.75]|uniref:uncharacterized protein n=1 Tax=Thermothelomyces heterothallicus CBS 202.75 TaxID=1149848 RepID=UPI003742D441